MQHSTQRHLYNNVSLLSIQQLIKWIKQNQPHEEKKEAEPFTNTNKWLFCTFNYLLPQRAPRPDVAGCFTDRPALPVNSWPGRDQPAPYGEVCLEAASSRTERIWQRTVPCHLQRR